MPAAADKLVGSVVGGAHHMCGLVWMGEVEGGREPKYPCDMIPQNRKEF